MTDRKIIGVVHDTLKNRQRWYLDCSISEENPILHDIAEKAKEEADSSLSSLSSAALYQRYRMWLKSDHFPTEGGRYFNQFLSDIAFDLGRKALQREEKLIYEDSCGIQFKFI